MIFLLKALYFFLPAYIANMSPVFVKKINFLNYPVDLNKVWKGKRILGDHKTYRGFFFGTIIGALFFELQVIFYNNGFFQNLALIDYRNAPIYLGLVIAFSALFGDSVKSFFKRRFNIRPGKPWVPFDQLDFMVFAVICTLPWSGLSLIEAFLVMLVIFFLTLIVQYIGYLLKLKDDRL